MRNSALLFGKDFKKDRPTGSNRESSESRRNACIYYAESRSRKTDRSNPTENLTKNPLAKLIYFYSLKIFFSFF